MSKLKNVLPNLFKSSKKSGRLESDALPVDDRDDNANMPSVNSTPTASADMTAAVVQELSDPNYNSMEVAGLNTSTAATNANYALTPSSFNSAVSLATTNTMNVHNAQQQLVMQISNVDNLHFGSVFNFNSNSTNTNTTTCGGSVDVGAGTSYKPPDEQFLANGTGEKRQTPRKTTSIVIMMQSQEEPNHRMLDTIATHLGEGWKQVIRCLGLSEGQIEQAVIDHQMHGGIKEVIYQLLLQWQRNADDGVATLGYLTTLLWTSNQRECVQLMKLVWKSETNRKNKS